MKIFSVVGHSNSGKTRLIARLVPELRRRGLTAAVVKHCSHGYDLGGEEKDSAKFLAAGAQGVGLAAPGQTMVLRAADCMRDLASFAIEEFGAADVILVEGGKGDSRLRKIEVLRAGISGAIATPLLELEAVVSDYPIACDRPHFHPDEVERMADWLAGARARETAAPVKSAMDLPITESEFFMRRDPAVLAALRSGTVAIAGAGGLGSNVAVSLARAGVGKLIIADFDRLDLSNLNRQYYFVDQIGKLKVEALKENLIRVNPFSIYEIHNIKIDRENAGKIFGSADLLIEAFDLAAQKQMLVEAWLADFPQKPVIMASGLAGYGGNSQLQQRSLGSLYVCGDEAGECEADVTPMAPRVALVANMQANLAVELLVNLNGRKLRSDLTMRNLEERNPCDEY